MSQSSASTPAAASVGPATGNESDWTDQVTDLIVDTVDKLHDRTTGVLIQACRAVVYGTVAGLVGVVVLIALIIFVVRALDLLPGDIWMAYVGGGAVLTLAGLVAWSKRHPVSD